MILSEKFNLQNFTDWIENFLPELSLDLRKVDVPNGLSDVKSIQTLGESNIGVRIFVIETERDPSGRKIGLAKESFNIIKNYGTPNALIAYYSEDSSKWRLSLLTSTAEWSEGKIITKLSNPKRQSYLLGPHSKVNTPTRFLLKKDAVTDIADLKSRFSLEVVNKEFYKEISESFIKLVGGTLGTGKNQKKYNAVLKLPSIADHSQTSIEFAVRLIGRIIFCWFLREKKSSDSTSLMPKELVSLEAINNHSDYYHQVLEPIFFEVLNQQVKSRKDSFYNKPYSLIPYLNGGLFSPHEDDFYKRNNSDFQSQFHNTLVIPDEWFVELFKTLETYNFTIDENTSFDEELSIDPEMLGRIFENLLAEINPETGESARKSTGSYYTPRVIVDYMVDESLLLYLKQQTEIEESKLRAIISYDLTDDTQHPLNENEKQKAIDALEKIKILDPACGSGAFPIGALQKMVFILQQIDPDGQLWFKKQIQHTSPEIRRVLEREFTHKNFDYIRKLGVIRENIYGIDIQPIATEISRLRCFLTLVVDQAINDQEENRGIHSLPNLDFKFVTANSLIGLPKTDQPQQTMFDDYESIDELKEVRNDYFEADPFEREQLKTKFSNKKLEIFKALEKEHGWVGIAKAELTQKLTDWDPFSHKACDWFDPEWMFGIKTGFDVVLANPPWGADLKKEEKQKLKELYPSIDSSTPNSFAYFIGLALNMNSRIISFVLPDSILIKDFARTRRLLAPCLTEISWYQNTGLPENLRPFVYVEHDVCVLFATKSTSQSFRRILNKYDLSTKSIISQSSFVKKEKVILEEFDFVYNLAVNDNDLKILDKLKKFESIDKYFQCHEGIHTGNVRSKLFKKEHLGNSYKELYYGAGTGGDTISNYFSKRDGWYVDYRKEIIDNNSGEYASLRDERIFKHPKIYITRTGNPFKAFLDEDTYASNNFFSLQLKNYQENNIETLKLILPFIVSKLSQYFIRKFSAPRLGNTFVETKIIHLLKMRVPKLSEKEKERIVEMVNNAILLTQNNSLDKLKELQYEIDRVVYRLYGLTDAETETIEKI